MFRISLLLLSSLGCLASFTLARDIPDNVRSLYDSIKGNRECSNILQDGFTALYDESSDFAYCQGQNGVIYLQGTSGTLADMDIDCDGVQGSQADDGRCGNSGDTHSITSFADTVASYGQGPDDLDANIHPYVVFGNEGSKDGYVNFDPREYGIEPLGVMGVVCGDQLIYGVWGDTNGDDGPAAMVGEASISLATACFGSGITGDNGYSDLDVLYIAFPGSSAVPGAAGADWAAGNFDDFEASIESLGDRLISQLSRCCLGT
ncbi:chitosanase [Xylariaceae sp. FL1019]|nr:chitosanase [Xylariaceae sp. FL1019]